MPIQILTISCSPVCPMLNLFWTAGNVYYMIQTKTEVKLILILALIFLVNSWIKMCSLILTFKCFLPQWYPECLMIVVEDYLCQFKSSQFRAREFMSCFELFFWLLGTFITRFELKQKPNVQNSPVTSTSGLAKVFLITW